MMNNNSNRDSIDGTAPKNHNKDFISSGHEELEFTV